MHLQSSSNLRGNRPKLSVVKETKDANGVTTGTVLDKSACVKDCKDSQTFAHSSDEDGEHFLEVLETMQKEPEVEWKAASEAKANDATSLFQAVDRMLLHSANAEWMDAVGRCDKKNPNDRDKNWEKFKTCAADFVTRAAFKQGAHNRQKSCLQGRVKPFDLSTKEWSLQLETVGRLMPWLIRNATKVQKETAHVVNWKGWWTQVVFRKLKSGASCSARCLLHGTG